MKTGLRRKPEFRIGRELKREWEPSIDGNSKETRTQKKTRIKKEEKNGETRELRREEIWRERELRRKLRTEKNLEETCIQKRRELRREGSSEVKISQKRR